MLLQLSAQGLAQVRGAVQSAAGLFFPLDVSLGLYRETHIGLDSFSLLPHTFPAAFCLGKSFAK